MGKLEIAGMVGALLAVVGVESSDAPVEDRLVETTRVLLSMTHSEFETWCDGKRAKAVSNVDETTGGTVTCAWIERDTERAWHAALHFDGVHETPTKADAGLVDASESTVLRLVANEFGSQDTNTGEGFPVWKIDVDGRPGRLTVAPFEDITLVRMAREDEPAVLTTR